eukprot:CAMPEP_0117663906 /NCGR_PEP_ID=MMETSP0804-20121206/8884_1 /TAXON_ID=1074897 /ORGANISM="Tetraselmis astigmatica, Strain CCMP880" /LENGTH=199 /DNA_ID=CAMNT_0005470999 /DNA_START=423 /DNA_END=1019 /DNA_ORIENTATION=+
MALQESSPALATSTVKAVGTCRKAEVVLDEDEYTEKLEHIIERDFFPDVPHLRNKLEWLQAVNGGDPVAVRNAQINIAARRAGIPTPLGATPAAFTTPAANATPSGTTGRPGSVLRTPGLLPPGSVISTPALGGGGINGDPASADLLGNNVPQEGLNAFLKNHTSEDNASFAEIVDEGNKRQREKSAWLYEDKNKQLLL